jgi:hypothetical protein
MSAHRQRRADAAETGGELGGYLVPQSPIHEQTVKEDERRSRAAAVEVGDRTRVEFEFEVVGHD